MKVFITREIPDIAFQLLKKHKIPFEFYKNDSPIPRKILLDKVKYCTALISLLTEKIDAELIDLMSRCKIIANVAVGYNNIDVKYAKKKNIIVTNTPDVLTESAADLTIALALASARRLYEGESLVRANKFKGWKPKMLLGVELKNKIFGILGAGRIGTAVAKRAHSFGTKIFYFDRSQHIKLEKKINAKKVSLRTLLTKSDFISIHLPLTKLTYHLFNEEKLKLLKTSAILINTARGEIIDETALIKILTENRIRAAGLDVYEHEPEINPQFLKLKNVILLPHIGSATEEARNAMAELAAKNVINVLKGMRPLTPVF
ncbi:MAG TPA: D-glycerate dehydrogenase [Ignavibacteriaceae bacterium]|nr:D-glycerate dehydrogenase [Ignavibacteriaceae bacterium]